MRTPPADLRLYYLQRPAPKFYHVASRVNTYFPSLETLFPSLTTQSTGSPSIASQEMAIDVSDGTSLVENIQTHEKRQVPTWIRMMHLVEPLAVLSGEYAIPSDGALPTFRTAWQRALRKLNDPFNEAYTDAVFACMASRLVETGRSPHFCRFYGTYSARVPTYSYNVTDDMGDIEGEAWYRDGLASGAFRIVASDPWDPDVTAEITRPWEDVRPRLFGSEGETASDESDATSVSSVSTGSKSDLESLEETDDIEVSGTAVLSRPQIQLARVGSPVQRSQGSHSSGSEDDIDYRLIVKDFPVQLTVLERCDGTLDDLMEDEIAEDATADMRETKEERWTAWMFQVIAALTAAQHHYDFIHNDLHTNNVMWCGTGETHLYYHVMGAAGGDRFYRVPTFGRIMKIIDFGRATFKPPVLASSGTNRTWFPDAYAPDADAGGQYNCGPYYEHGRPKVSPNKSFDLCRLAVAMLEAMWPTPNPVIQPQKVMTREPGRVQHETTSPLWNLLWLWLTDKNGKNILYTPDGSERYPRFDLYCAIAKDAQNSVPAQQLTLPLFDSAFRCRRRDISSDATIYKLTAVHK